MTSGPNTYIAIVDDDESICRSFGRLLRAAGYQPIAYSSAEGILKDAKHPRFDCYVLDVQLTGMSGLELRKHLAASDRETPVIFITSHDDPAGRAEALASGCAGYFRKTDSGTDVLAAIRNAVEHPRTTIKEPS